MIRPLPSFSPNGAAKPDAPNSPASGFQLSDHASAGRGFFGRIFGTLTERVALLLVGNGSASAGEGLPRPPHSPSPALMDEWDERSSALLEATLEENAARRERLLRHAAQFELEC